MLSSTWKEFWICESWRYDIGAFVNYTCADVHSVFTLQTVQIGPFEVECLPAQIYCVLIGIFASFVGPFAGFAASGFKRAYGVKDFAATFPGHGGFVDRFDC